MHIIFQILAEREVATIPFMHNVTESDKYSFLVELNGQQQVDAI